MPTYYKGTKEEKYALNAYIKLMRAAESVASKLNEYKTYEGLSISQFGTLEALYHLGPMYQKDIGRKILKSSGNITMVIDNLEEKDLVERKRDERDRRYITISLTEKGEDLIAGILPGHIAAIVEIMSALDKNEKDELGALCRKLGLAVSEKK